MGWDDFLFPRSRRNCWKTFGSVQDQPKDSPKKNDKDDEDSSDASDLNDAKAEAEAAPEEFRAKRSKKAAAKEFIRCIDESCVPWFVCRFFGLKKIEVS